MNPITLTMWALEPVRPLVAAGFVACGLIAAVIAWRAE